MSLTKHPPHARAKIQPSTNHWHRLPDESLIFGSSERMLSLRAQLRALAGSNLPVLIEGERGTGKEVIARLLHKWSSVANGPFIHISCPAILGTQFESELFGKQAGPLSGVSETGGNRSPLASGGTLCLDEIGELDPSLQAKLLQFLQDGQFLATDTQHLFPPQTRVVFASDCNLEEKVVAGKFRRDLLYRINVVTLRLPALRERPMDLPDLCMYFVKLYNQEFNCEAEPLSPDFLFELQRLHWPGNIRQLANLMKSYVVLDSDDVVRQEIANNSHSNDSTPVLATNGISLQDAAREVRRSFERQQILKALETNQWNRKRAARALNISYRALLYKLKECRFESSSID